MEIPLVVLVALVEVVLIMQIHMVVLEHLVKEMLEETQTLKEVTHTHLEVEVRDPYEGQMDESFYERGQALRRRARGRRGRR